MKAPESDSLDALLARWPAPEADGDAEWEARAAATMAKARDAGTPSDEAVITGLLAPPPLLVEPGEPGQSPAAYAPGESKMSNDSEDRGKPSGPDSLPSSMPSSLRPSERKGRESLKALAERAAAAPRSLRPAAPAAATPLPPAARTPLPGAASASPPSVVTPLPSRRPARPVEAGDEDSGMVDLHAVNSSVTEEQVASAAAAKPGVAGLYDEDAPTPAPKTQQSAIEESAPIARAARKKGSGGLVAGGAIAFVGLAAAAAMLLMNKSPGEPVASAPPAAEVAAAPEGSAPLAEANPAATAEPAEVAAAPTDEPAPAGAEPTGESGKLALGGAGSAPRAGGDPKASATPGDAKAAPDPAAGAAPAKPGEPEGDLASAMQKAVGADGKPVETNDAAEPAAGKSRSQSIPEQPSQGSVTSAIGSVMGGAKGCVSGADDITRATVTFGSSGSVTSVSVSGWAASNGASGCVKSALQGANVGPFARPSYSIPVAIRP